jgi:thiosulfate reductase cytochrome b subunit
MIWSGILIYWANPIYLSPPDKVYEFFHLAYRLAEGMGWHFFLMWFFVGNGVLYLLYLMFSGEWRAICPARNDFKDAISVMLHDLGLRKDAPPTRGKYNAAQKIAYFFVLLMSAGSILTGLAIYKPVQLHALTLLLGGYEAARLEHFILMLGLVLFFAVHVIQVLRAGWNTLRAMVAGYEIESD